MCVCEFFFFQVYRLNHDSAKLAKKACTDVANETGEI